MKESMEAKEAEKVENDCPITTLVALLAPLAPNTATLKTPLISNLVTE